ncbi:hypothetical protein HPB51_012889 [Rhipicephalus microplus]|uniref:Uncharacterized protein n=1 Tax=Rhipicephalus microplus TaxID=6941 RepID=A0A9J6D9Q2_RHIMP|nr:hypothetical protein HPB51_012889 [Rhipicephalus microplus]
MGVNDGTFPGSAFPHHRPVARSNGVGRVAAQILESRERSSHQGVHSRESALYPVVHSTTKSARRLLWASLKGRQLLTSTLLYAQWPFLQRHSCGIASIGTGQTRREVADSPSFLSNRVFAAHAGRISTRVLGANERGGARRPRVAAVIGSTSRRRVVVFNARWRLSSPNYLKCRAKRRPSSPSFTAKWRRRDFCVHRFTLRCCGHLFSSFAAGLLECLLPLRLDVALGQLRHLPCQEPNLFAVWTSWTLCAGLPYYYGVDRSSRPIDSDYADVLSRARV